VDWILLLDAAGDKVCAPRRRSRRPRVLGEGEIDLAFVLGWFLHLEGRWEFPSRRGSSGVCAPSVLDLVDKYGIGPVRPGTSGLASSS
jgi:hypothetical protein